MPQRNLLILLIASAVSYLCYVRGEQNPYARYVGHGLAAIDAAALQRVPSDELFSDAMDAMIGVLHRHGDEHSQFIARDAADPFRAEMRQQFGGIGVRIRFTGDPPQLLIVGAPDPGTPAARAGILAGDRVLAIDGRKTDAMTMPDVLHAMRGRPGQPLRLSIRRTGETRPRTVDLVREVITVDAVLGDRRSDDGGWEFRLQSDPRIAHVRLTTFGSKTTEQLSRVLDQLTAEGVEAVVLDLRDDVGGALDTAVAICNQFLPEELLIVETRGRDEQLHARYLTDGAGPYQRLPLAVLVNRNSASASEIVAACLQDHQRAVIIGERTYGKGTVQRLIPIESGQSLLKLTSASYRRPNGRNIHRAAGASEEDDWGVLPDPGLEVTLTDEQYEAYRKHREARDLWGTAPADDSLTPESDDRADSAEPDTEFVDRQLATAVEFLQGMLGE